MTTQAWDVYLGNPGRPPGLLAELSRLRTALPRYDVILTGHGPTYRFEAIRRDDGPGPWCVISSDPGDLWRELAQRTRRGMDTGSPARAP